MSASVQERHKSVAVDVGVGRVARFQDHVAVAAAEHLDRGLVVNHRGDDVAVVRLWLLLDHHDVAVTDSGLDHGIAADP